MLEGAKKLNFNDSTLNELNDKKKEILIKETDAASLSIYTLETEINTTWTIDEITNEIITLHNNLIQENIKPNNYILTINDLNKENKSINFVDIVMFATNFLYQLVHFHS